MVRVTNLLLGILGLGVGGFLLKVVDWSGDLASLRDNRLSMVLLGFLSACVCGLILSYVSIIESGFFVIVSGVVLGVLLAGKVDTPYLLLGLIIVILGWIWLGNSIPLGEVSLLPILVVAFGGLFDEVGNNLADKDVIQGLFRNFFRYRGVLKVLVIALWILEILSVWGAIGLWIFDIGYLLSELSLAYFESNQG